MPDKTVSLPSNACDAFKGSRDCLEVWEEDGAVMAKIRFSRKHLKTLETLATKGFNHDGGFEKGTSDFLLNLRPKSEMPGIRKEEASASETVREVFLNSRDYLDVLEEKGGMMMRIRFSERHLHALGDMVLLYHGIRHSLGVNPKTHDFLLVLHPGGIMPKISDDDEPNEAADTPEPEVTSGIGGPAPFEFNA
jgi:hypothetical protein